MLNQSAAAQGHWQEALDLARALGDRRSEGEALAKLGKVTQAKQHWSAALPILVEIQSPMAETVRGWLAELDEVEG